MSKKINYLDAKIQAVNSDLFCHNAFQFKILSRAKKKQKSKVTKQNSLKLFTSKRGIGV